MFRLPLLLLLVALSLSAVLAQRRRAGGRSLGRSSSRPRLQGRPGLRVRAPAAGSRRGGRAQGQRLASRAGRARQRQITSSKRRQKQRTNRRGGRRPNQIGGRRKLGRRRGRTEAEAAASTLYGAPSEAGDAYGAPSDYDDPAAAAAEEYGAPSQQAGYAAEELDEAASEYSGGGTKSGFPSYVDRCGEGCQGEPEAEVCGSDGKTYPNSCELEFYACRKYWDIQEVSQGPCESTCPGVELGMYSGFGIARATNKGFCNHDFFRCCTAAKELGLDGKEVKACCNERYSQCSDFIASKPWKAGVERFGR